MLQCIGWNSWYVIAQMQRSNPCSLAHLGKQFCALVVVIKKFSELDDGCGIGHGLSPQINANKSARTGAVVQRFLAGQIGRVGGFDFRREHHNDLSATIV